MYPVIYDFESGVFKNLLQFFAVVSAVMFQVSVMIRKKTLKCRNGNDYPAVLIEPVM